MLSLQLLELHHSSPLTIQVESEIMKINTVSFGSTNRILVDRGWMGTGIATHPVGVAVTKVDGAYNIVGNTINFYTAPQSTLLLVQHLVHLIETLLELLLTPNSKEEHSSDLNQQIVQVMPIIQIIFLIALQINLMQPLKHLHSNLKIKM